MWGYYNPTATPAPVDTTVYHDIVYCQRCGCTFLDKCPEHPTTKVTFKPGDKGFVL